MKTFQIDKTAKITYQGVLSITGAAFLLFSNFSTNLFHSSSTESATRGYFNFAIWAIFSSIGLLFILVATISIALTWNKLNNRTKKYIFLSFLLGAGVILYDFVFVIYK